MSFVPIAIVGEGCVLPGALRPRELWELVREGRCAVSHAPASAWGLYPGADRERLAQETLHDVGGHVTGFERVFSPRDFQIPIDPELDPVFLWTLHAAREALRDAGRDVGPRPVRGAVILGNLSYPTPGLVRFALEVWGRKPPAHPQNRFMSGLPAALVARALGFEGPAFALDAACASSLYAMKLACDQLAEGRVDLAIAGGVNHADDLYLHLGFTALAALSPSGRSRPFHRDADGLVPAQGAAVVLLKRLSDALRDGDAIRGVIRGIGLSNDGRSRGLLVPSEDGQVRAMRQAYAMSGLAPSDISLVECHATGTAVGDAVEARSLKTIFAGASDVPIGSLKSNLGHLITASGAAGLLKVLAAMKSELRPATLEADTPLAEIDGPLRVLHASEPWPGDRPRRAAISNFGFGGNNAHMLVEEWRAESKARSVPEPSPARREPIAVVAMAVHAGSADSTEAFEAALFSPHPEAAPTIEAFALDLSGLRFPPADLAEAIPQQTLLLRAAALLREPLATLPPRTSVLVGMQCDAEVARSSLRWRRAGALTGRLTDKPLNAATTVGCMPNMVANRLNQQLGAAAPSYAVSAEEASGTIALALAMHDLAAGEIDAAVVAAVDLSDEPVQRAAAEATQPEGRKTPGDAVVMMVLKRLRDARRDDDRVLAILEEPTEAAPPQTLGLDDARDGLSWLFGHAHAASGLLHVAAAIAACHRRMLLPTPSRTAMPWLPEGGERRMRVRVQASGGAVTECDVVAASTEGRPGPPAESLAVFAADEWDDLRQALASGAGSSPTGSARLRVAIVAPDPETLSARITRARQLLAEKPTLRTGELSEGIHFGQGPLEGEVACVFGGPAGAYAGMGRELLLARPSLVDAVHARMQCLRDAAGWLYERDGAIAASPEEKLWGSSFLIQAHAELVLQVLGVRPHASIGYCSGETNALFALGAWSDLDDFREEIAARGVYSRELAGELRCLKRAWALDDDAPVGFTTLRVRAPLIRIREALQGEARAHLTIIHGPDDAVVAGDTESCERVVARLGPGRARPLGYDFVMHCPEARVFSSEWRALHRRPTRPVAGVRFYTHATLSSYSPTDDSAADALLGQAMGPIDFPAMVERAYGDGVRVFIEHGPHAACTRWIDDILGDRPHLAVALDRFGRSSLAQVTESVARLFAAGVPLDPSALASFAPPPDSEVPAPHDAPRVQVTAHLSAVRLPEAEVQRMLPPPAVPAPLPEHLLAAPAVSNPIVAAPEHPLAAHHQDLAALHIAFLQRLAQTHRQFLDVIARLPLAAAAEHVASPMPGPALDRAALEAIASGPLSPVLGPLFAEQDRFRRVVRMPEPPLLLADRVLGIEGQPYSMGLGTIWTETDVTPAAWYLHEGRMPAGIVVEAGQADLLLISWLGIDRLNRGERVYRLLGCDLTLHGELPRPGDTLTYDIHVDGHAQQGDVRLFFFHYDCRVNGALRMSVRHGQAGFFTDDELAASGGVLFHPDEADPTPDPRLDPPVVVCGKRALNAAEIEAFTEGRTEDCFGDGFHRAQSHTRTPRMQGGRLRLIDEVTQFDPAGGPWGRGYLRATLALSPDHWFYQGHFKDDPCMPGTLMLEGGLQAMSIYLAALGFTLERDGFLFMPVPDAEYRLRCRGQATPASKELVYEIFVDELIAGPTPTVFADLLGTVDGVKAFHCRRMGLRLAAAYPMEVGRLSPPIAPETSPPTADGFTFDARSLLACAWGRPSEAFGPMYAPFDLGKLVPRLPGPPYHFMSRIVSVEGPIGGLQVGSEVHAEYDVPEDAWYFAENGSAHMPFAILQEVALQPCGWLASYVGCAVSAEPELAFRNLDGTGVVHRAVTPGTGTLSTTSRLTSLSRAGDVIIVAFDVEIRSGGDRVFEAHTVFGFFTTAAMRDQLGLPKLGEEMPPIRPFPIEDLAGHDAPPLANGRLKMIDEVVSLWPDGGAAQLGRIIAKRRVSPADWYFRAHFFRDPVQPGSLGLEAMVQALEILSVGCGLTSGLVAPRFEALAAEKPITWKYRGQVLPENESITVDLSITGVERTASGPIVTAEGSLWVDSKRIYHASGVSLRVRAEAIEAVPESAATTRLFLLTGGSPEELLADLTALSRELGAGPTLERVSHARLASLSTDPPLVCALVARSSEELRREVGWARTGIARAFSEGRPFMTPAGSYFAPHPLGRTGKVAFIYPGMGSASPGSGAALFTRFPTPLQKLRSLPGFEAESLRTDLVPEARLEPFARDTAAVSRASMVLSFLYTRLLGDDFGVSPHMASGFSIGEGSMFAALSVWPEPGLLERRLALSRVFSERLSGPMLAAREHLGVALDAPFSWRAVIVRASADAVREAIAKEPAVFLLTIHTPEEAMIAGEAEACRRVTEAIGAPHLPAPFQLTIHCAPALRERTHLAALHRLPVASAPEIAFYSAAADTPVAQDSEAIAEVLARSYTSTVDFPRLVRRLYEDGARIFVELGAQSNCARWIERNLSGLPHACAPLNAAGIDEDAGLLRGLAVLLSHRVPVDVSPLLRPYDAPCLPPPPAPLTSPDDAETLWESLLLREVARLLSASDPAQIPRDAPLPLDSLAVMELRAKLEASLGVTITPELFLQHRTIRSLAAALAGLRAEEVSPRVPFTTSTQYRGSWSQYDMWHMPRQISSRLKPEELHRTVPILWTRSRIEVIGPLDVERLRGALLATFDRHAILRSVVRDAAAGPPLVALLPEWLPEVRMSNGSALAREHFFAQPLDPVAGPPARLAIFRTDPEAHEIGLHQHHLFTDGLSLALFWKEVIARYLGAPLPPAGPSFEEYGRALDAWLASRDSEPSRAYWEKTLRGVPPIALPFDTPRTEPYDFAGERLDLAIGAELFAPLDALCRRESVGMFSVLLWALAEALREEVDQEDILLSTFHANRSLPGFPGALDVMGPLSQGLFFRCQAGGPAPRLQRLQEVHRIATEALAHGSVPTCFLREQLGLPLPAQQVSLVYQSFVSAVAMEVGPLTIRTSEPIGFGQGHAAFELELVLWPDGGGLKGVAAYATQVFRRPTVERITRRFIRALSSLLE